MTGIAYRDMTPKQREHKKEIARKYYEKNKEACKARVKAYRKKNPEKIADAAREYYNKNLTQIKTQQKKYIKKYKKLSENNPILTFNKMLSICKTRSKYMKRKCDLDINYIQYLWNRQKGLCKLTKSPMSTKLGIKHSRVSIDRINSQKGYIKGNCQLVLASVNIAKNDRSLKDFIKMCKAIAKYN
jgi:hypothetical protein